MKLIVCIDSKGGMLFNKRRQSRDKLLIENVLKMCKSEPLYTNEYSAPLFPEKTVTVTGNFDELKENDCLFAENIIPNEENINEIIVYKWNRVYPADTYFNINLSSWNLAETVDFTGNSHEKIIREIYVR